MCYYITHAEVLDHIQLRGITLFFFLPQTGGVSLKVNSHDDKINCLKHFFFIPQFDFKIGFVLLISS